jgi:GAG-pre-integrase domain
MHQFSAFLASRNSWRCRHLDKNNSLANKDGLLCQLCFKKGHTADRCYKRFDATYKPPPPRPPPRSRQHQSQPQALFIQLGSAPAESWYMDSGASAHVTSDLNALTTYSPYTGNDQLQVGNGKGLDIVHIGTASLSTNSSFLLLNKVLHVPAISKPLISISQLLLDNNVFVEFHPDCCIVKDRMNHQVLLQGVKCNGLYLVSSPSPQALICEKGSLTLWHKRLCHISANTIQHLVSSQNLSCTMNKLGVCEPCCLAKSHILLFYPSSSTATKPLEIIHCDLWGPSPVISQNGYKYYLLFTDQFSRYNWIYFCSHKSNVADIFHQFKILVENLLFSKIKTIQLDGGTEFKPIIRSHPEIQFHISCPYTPQQNGLVERKHRHIVELSLATMFNAGIPQTYWPDIFETVTFVIKTLPTSSTSFKPLIIRYSTRISIIASSRFWVVDVSHTQGLMLPIN